MNRIFDTSEIKIGLVVGTFAATPYIHLHLESWRRNYPHIPILINDDGSPRQLELNALSETYGVEFKTNKERYRRTVGDLSAYVNGLQWAKDCGINLLVKMSRRFLPLFNWVPDLQRLAYESQYATYSNQCRHFHFGFRTECIGFHVDTWFQSGAYSKIEEQVRRNEPIFVEGFIHRLARELQSTGYSEANREFELANPRPPDADGYGVWEIMADRRTVKKPDILWHDCDQPVDYCRIAQLYGLRYTVSDFTDPNQNCGLGEE
jgi:hypothetical protein